MRKVILKLHGENKKLFNQNIEWRKIRNVSGK